MRRVGRIPKIPHINVTDPQGMGAFIPPFLEWLQQKAYSEFTMARHCHALKHFIYFCDERGITRATEVTKPILERYQRHLFHYRSASNGAPLNVRTQNKYLTSIKAFFSYLAKQNFILSNPAADVEMARVGRRLPRVILSAPEVEQILNGIPLNDGRGLRDRAIVETLYATGIRRLELVELKISDVDFQRETLLVCDGKGRKDRMIPIGERALAWLRKYLEDVRGSYVTEPDKGTLFLTRKGEELHPDYLSRMVKRYIEGAKLGKKGSCHLFRHSMATLMLEGGADIRFIQHILGHSDLATTSIYTQVSIHKLMEVYMASHPGARLERKKPDPEAFAEAEKRLEAEQELFSTLAAEEEEETPKKRKSQAVSARPGARSGSASKIPNPAKRGGSDDRPPAASKGRQTAGRTAR